MKLPEKILPVLRTVASHHSLPVELWQASDGNRIMDAFSDLATRISLAKMDLHSLPKGYGLLETIFRWERECQFEGWNAFEWNPDPAAIVDAYSEAGLEDEAKAISRAAAAWKESPEDYDAITAAYENVRHKHSVDVNRLEYLVDYFCSRAEELFYEPE